MFFLAAFTLVCVFSLVKPALAFGAGTIPDVSAIKGSCWRHGDIEETLLQLSIAAVAAGGRRRKFTEADIKRIYFGNWLRDYSQAVDVASLKMVSGDAVNILIRMLGFMTFGLATGAFEVTGERLGCYRPEEHIDNPKGYGEGTDAQGYDRRLRGPVRDEELEIDPRTGMKAYIASEDHRIVTSAGFVRETFLKSIDFARRYGRDGNEANLHEALRLLGTGLHTLEDFTAHSNYVELVLRELGENVFPHVGDQTEIELEGKRVFPLVTGTFGGVDFLHSVLGEVNDKATQSEVQQLETQLENASQSEGSILKNILSKIPGLGEQSEKMDELEHQQKFEPANPVEKEAFAAQAEQLLESIQPVLEFHDSLALNIAAALDSVPGLADIISDAQDQLNMYVFSLIASYLLPILKQMQSELLAGSSAVIASSEAEQLAVFEDPYLSDPTHSMLAKDHFSNVLNNVGGKVSCAVVRWVVPQLMAAWDDEAVDANGVLDRIVSGVLHHPAQCNVAGEWVGGITVGQEALEGRQIMFDVVREWWQNGKESWRDDLRECLSPDGVRNERNHNPDLPRCGHGAADGKLSMARVGLNRKDDGQAEVVKEGVQAALGGGLLGAAAGFVAGALVSGGAGDSGSKNDRHDDRVSSGKEREKNKYQSDKSSHDQSSYDQKSYGQTSYGESSFGQSHNDQSRFGQSPNDQSRFGQSHNDQSSYGQDRHHSKERNENRYHQSRASHSKERREQTESRRNQNEHQSERYNKKSDNEYGQQRTHYGEERKQDHYSQEDRNESRYQPHDDQESSRYNRQNEASSQHWHEKVDSHKSGKHDHGNRSESRSESRHKHEHADYQKSSSHGYGGHSENRNRADSSDRQRGYQRQQHSSDEENKDARAQRYHGDSDREEHKAHWKQGNQKKSPSHSRSNSRGKPHDQSRSRKNDSEDTDSDRDDRNSQQYQQQRNNDYERRPTYGNDHLFGSNQDRYEYE